MLRSCVVPLGIYAAIGAGYWWWLRQQFDPPGVWIGSAVVGLIVTLCVGALLNARVAFREWSLISSARRDLPWFDGQWTALAGEIHPVGEALVAPFSGKECVLCEYEAARRNSSSNDSDGKPGLDFTGFLMNPCVVRTRMGDVRLLGFPNLAGVDEDELFTSDAVRRAREFLTTTTFDRCSGLNLVEMIGAIKEAWTDDDGLVRKNVQLGSKLPQTLFGPELEARMSSLPRDADDTDELEDEDEEDESLDDEELDDGGMSNVRPPMLKERRVKVGEKVCAIGVYSGEKRGLVPGGSGTDRFIRLIRGGIDKVEARTRDSAFANLIGGLIVLAVVNAAAFGVMMANRYHPSEVRRRREEATQAVTQGNIDPLAKLVARGVEINGRDAEGRTLLLHAREPAMARWLIEQGADVNAYSSEGYTPLMEATRYGRGELAEALIDGKADVNLRSEGEGLTALDLAERNGYAAVVEQLRNAGARSGVAIPLPEK